MREKVPERKVNWAEINSWKLKRKCFKEYILLSAQDSNKTELDVALEEFHQEQLDKLEPNSSAAELDMAVEGVCEESASADPHILYLKTGPDRRRDPKYRNSFQQSHCSDSLPHSSNSIRNNLINWNRTRYGSWGMPQRISRCPGIGLECCYIDSTLDNQRHSKCCYKATELHRSHPGLVQFEKAPAESNKDWADLVRIKDEFEENRRSRSQSLHRTRHHQAGQCSSWSRGLLGQRTIHEA